MLSGKVSRNYIQGMKGHHSRDIHRQIATGRTKGTDATNLRPLENAPFHSSFRTGVAIKGRSADDRVPGNLKPNYKVNIPYMGLWFAVGLVVAFVLLSRSR